MKGITIARMEEAHIPEAVALAAECFSEPWSYGSFRAEVCNPHAIPLVALCGDVVAGFLCAVCICGEGTLNLIAVREEYRRRGIGETLLRELFCRASLEGAERFSLEVRESNLPAQRLYGRFGFTPAGRRKDFYKNPTEDALVLTTMDLTMTTGRN